MHNKHAILDDICRGANLLCLKDCQEFIILPCLPVCVDRPLTQQSCMYCVSGSLTQEGGGKCKVLDPDYNICAKT